MQFAGEECEVRDLFMEHFDELAADVLGIWLLGKSAGMGFVAYMHAKAPWSCVASTSERNYFIAAAMECLFNDRGNSIEHDLTKKNVADKLVRAVCNQLDHLPGAKKWSDIDECEVRKHVSAFREAGSTRCLTDKVNWTQIDPVHKVVAAFMASIDMPNPNEQPSPDFGSIPLAQDETYINQAIGKVTEEEYVQNIFDAMIASLQ